MPRKARKNPRQKADSKPSLPAETPRFKIWDAHLRASHTLITLLFTWQFLSGQFGLSPDWLHLWAGYALLVVVLFRMGWGFVGSETARFSSMTPSPRALIDYLPLLFSRQPSHWAGHNPVGALSTVVLLGLLLIQSVTGLFVETWGELRGPLADRVSGSTQLWMNDLHDLLRWPLLALVLVHLVAVLGYLLGKKEDRIRPIFGSGEIALPSEPRVTFHGGPRAWLVWMLSLVTVLLIVWLGPVA
ncbi:MAG: cytochrome b/b6 domain-containing protein [Wenzhouxiangella sp.]